MRDDIHLRYGTRVVNTVTKRFGTVTMSHYLARPVYNEISVHYDDMREGIPGFDEPHVNEPRKDIEYDGSEIFIRLVMESVSLEDTCQKI